MGEEDENGNASRMRVVVRIRPINARELANNEGVDCTLSFSSLKLFDYQKMAKNYTMYLKQSS